MMLGGDKTRYASAWTTSDLRMDCVKCGRSVKVPRRGMCRRCHKADLVERRAAGPIDGLVKQDPLERIMEKVAVTSDCWLWTGQLNNMGYGLVWYLTGKRAAHRVLWELLVGPVPAGLELDHLCRVTRCVNPDHLEPVTHGENIRRGFAAKRAREAAAARRSAA